MTQKELLAGSYDDKVYVYKMSSQAVPQLRLTLEVDNEKEMSRVVRFVKS